MIKKRYINIILRDVVGDYIDVNVCFLGQVSESPNNIIHTLYKGHDDMDYRFVYHVDYRYVVDGTVGDNYCVLFSDIVECIDYLDLKLLNVNVKSNLIMFLSKEGS